MDCIFCKIINSEIPSKKVYEDEMILAFHDIAPQAPVHVLVIPKAHIDDCSSIDNSNADYVKHIFLTIPEITKRLGLNDYRIVANCGLTAGQTVFHLHFHILGGDILGTMV